MVVKIDSAGRGYVSSMGEMGRYINHDLGEDEDEDRGACLLHGAE